MNEEKRTPGPWEVKGKGISLEIWAKIPFKTNCVEFVLKNNYQCLFYTPYIQFPPKKWLGMQEANAAFIVKACNNHDHLTALNARLLAACSKLFETTIYLETDVMELECVIKAIEEAKLAIREAKGNFNGGA